MGTLATVLSIAGAITVVLGAVTAVYKLLSNAALANENAKLRDQLMASQREAQRLAGELRTAEAKLTEKQAIRSRDGLIYLARDDGGEDGPFCQLCFQAGRGKFSTDACYSPSPDGGPDVQLQLCPVCGRVVRTPGSPPGPAAAPAAP